MMPTDTETRAKYRERRIRELAPWWHRIDLGNGLVTKDASLLEEPVDHPQALWERVRQVTPVSYTGAHVLDVGCNAGYCSFAAEKLGAARVVGVDSVSRHIAQARFVKKVSRSKVEFRQLSAYDIRPKLGKFDIVLLLGVVYHCRHPLLVLDRLRKVTEGCLVVESATFLGGRPEELCGLSAPPLWLVDNPPGSEELFNWFVPSPEALTAMLRACGFRHVLHEEIFRQRALVVVE